MAENFKRKIEDFICENCGEKVKGDGYTNHCPRCLWSKHVDNNPGDREANCGGMMKPENLEFKNKQYKVTHRCSLCGHKKKNKLSPEDNLEKIME